MKKWLKKHFHEFEHFNWKKVAWVFGALAAAWAFLQGVVPEPWHDRLLGVWGFLAAFITTLIKFAKDDSAAPAAPQQDQQAPAAGPNGAL